MTIAAADTKFFWLPPTPHANERRHERFSVRIPACLRQPDSFQRVTIANISCGGMMLVGTFGLYIGDAITVDLIGGRRIAGHIVWSTGSNCGACFSEALGDDDPLLQGALLQGRRTAEV